MGYNDAVSWYERMLAALEEEIMDEEFDSDEDYMDNSEFA